MAPKKAAATRAPPTTGGAAVWKPSNKAETDEAVRILAIFKTFTERGKLPASLVVKFLKEVMKKQGLKEATVKKVVAAGKEAAPKLGTNEQLTAGDMNSWYFATAWPELLKDKEEKAQRKARINEALAAGAEDGTSWAQTADRTGDFGSTSHGGSPQTSSFKADRPLGPAALAAKNVDGDALRRLLKRIKPALLPMRHDLGPYLLLPADRVHQVLREELAPIQDEALLSTAPMCFVPGSDDCVDASQLVKWWFDEVWPVHGETLHAEARRWDEEHNFKFPLPKVTVTEIPEAECPDSDDDWRETDDFDRPLQKAGR